MSQTGSSAGLSDPTDGIYSEPRATGWVGWVVFAGTMMLFIGSLHIIEGLVAVLDPEYFLVTKSGLTVHSGLHGVGMDAHHCRRDHRLRRASASSSVRCGRAIVGVIVARGDQRAAELRVHRGVPVLVPHHDRAGRPRDPRPHRARQGDEVLLGGHPVQGSFGRR